MTSPALRLAAASCGLLLAAGAAAAEGGVYWEQTVQMEMKGVPFAMPAQTQKICMPADRWDRPPQAQKDKNCELKDVKVSGQTMTWKMICTGDQAMTGEGELTRAGDTFKGRTHLAMDQGEMTMKFSGKKLGGACDPGEQQKKAEAMKKRIEGQQAEAEAKGAELDRVQCDSAVKNMQAQAVAGGRPLCKDPARKAEFCARMRTGGGWRQAMQFAEMERSSQGAIPGPKAAAQACGVDLEKVKAELCAKGEKVDDLDFLAEQCPAESKALALRECGGRDYTAMAGSRYGSFCAKAWDGSLEAKPAAKARKPKVDAKDAAVEEGKKALKGVLGF